jgi:hypothetical protein
MEGLSDGGVRSQLIGCRRVGVFSRNASGGCSHYRSRCESERPSISGDRALSMGARREEKC